MTGTAHPTLRCDQVAIDAGPCRLVETLCGLRQPSAGRVSVCGEPVASQRRRTLARRITMVTQQQHDAFAASVTEHVALGRYPHAASWPATAGSDGSVVSRALDAVALGPFAARDVTTLSGGERQRAAIARALVQDCPVTVFDEPLSQQDPAHALLIAELLAARAASGGTVVSSLHDVNLTARFASHALLLFGDGRWLFGAADEMLTPEQLSALYGVRVLRLERDGHALFVADPLAAGRTAR